MKLGEREEEERGREKERGEMGGGGGHRGRQMGEKNHLSSEKSRPIGVYVSFLQA